MKTPFTSWRPLLRAFYAFLIASAVLWVVPRTARAQLYVASRPSPSAGGLVGEYQAFTGAVVNAQFITGLPFPNFLMVAGNTLFVADDINNTVGKYDATTGAVINATFITGLDEPIGLAVKGDTLFVANFGGNTVGAYMATTGTTINASFITGLNPPTGILVRRSRAIHGQ